MGMEIQRKRSFNTSTVSHDFRKEYKGSYLEKKFRAKNHRAEKLKMNQTGSTLRTIAEWFFSKSAKKASRIVEAKELEIASNLERLPNELIFEILKNCKNDQSTMLACRRVSQRLHACMDEVAKQTPITILSRLVITGQGKKGIEMRWVSYEGQKTNTVMVSWQSIKNGGDFSFNFKRFAIQRVLLKNVALSDELVDFIRHQLQFSDISKLIQLSLNNIDFFPANSLTLHRLIAPMAKSLEIFEVTQGCGMRPESVTDEHLAQLDASTIRRVCIDGVRFAGAAATWRHLKVGDGALKRLASHGAFPTMILDRCAVTTKVVCDYTKEWFEQCNESEKQMRSQVCTVKRCPKVRGTQFEAECQKRGLRCKNRRGSGSLTLYNVQEENTKREFTIALAALEEKELAEKARIGAENLRAPIVAAV